MDNTFNSNGGEQNIAQGDHAIGKKENNTQEVRGDGNIFSSTGNVHVEQHIHQPPQPVIPRYLPPLDTCFLGRDTELDALLEQLQPGKVAAVCGPGGMGKSALAAQAVSKLEPDRFPDGIIFHSFYHQPSTDMALQTICNAFQAEAKAGLASTVRQALAGRKALLILDGAEEADDLPAVLALRSTCGVLITSRKRADAQGFRLDLKPLEERPAAEVFCEHSGAAADDESVAGICKILDGWPVGLRIAGRYCSSMGESAAGYLRWLEQEPFKELGDGEHQEENAALLLRRSVAQVSDDARLALGVAGTLAFAPIAREPVAAILDADERRARAALNELVNYGLLEKREERWQISHALVHTYARTELALSKKSLKRLAHYYIFFCEIASNEGVKGYALLDAERAHCLRLMESCLNSGLLKAVQGLVWALQEYLDRQGHWVDRITALEMNLKAAWQTGDRRDEGACLNSLGYTCNRRGDHTKALSYLEQSLPIARELGDRQGEGVTLNNIAIIYNYQGKYELALQQYEQCLTIQREVGDLEGEGTTLNNIGEVYRTQGDNETALKYYEQDLAICRKRGDKIGEGITLDNISGVYREQGNFAKALEYHRQALMIQQQLGDRAGQAVTCWNIGAAYYDQGDLAAAEEYMSHAVQLAEKIGHPLLQQFRDELAQVRAARQATPEA
ncbi:tetratricopeptide repeat protein [Candidatus Electronema sp. JC]|uniref:tetratricopeptide repeat protein n=1 Tax=Candidatus Electronema sp. JC TaxID=3401570 RepID=UPI003AA82EA2